MRRTWLHIQFWLAYVLAFIYLNITLDATSFELLPDNAWARVFQQLIVQIIFLTVKVPVVYACLFLLDRYLRQLLTPTMLVAWLFPLLALGAVAMSVVNHLLVMPLVWGVRQSEYSIFSTGSLMYHLLALAFVAGIAATFKLIRWQHRTQLDITRLQAEKVEAELMYLKGQINPHFLFNTLNNIYSLARKGSEATAESVLKLSKLMRFMLFEAGRSRILLKNEIALIGDYIELERLRYTDRLRVDLRHELDNSSQEIAPLLLIHFVENAFKHGVSETHHSSFVDIDIKLHRQQLIVRIANSIPKTSTAVVGPQVGMENVKRQLELLYPSHQLSVTSDVDTFRVMLTIPKL